MAAAWHMRCTVAGSPTMSTVKHFAVASLFVVGSSLAGCAADAPDGDPNNPDDPSNPDNPAKQLDATGKFQLRSNFDLADKAPGKVGEVTRAIIDMTNSPEDPS